MLSRDLVPLPSDPAALAAQMAEGRSAYDEVVPGLWDLAALLALEATGEYRRADARRRFLETTPADLFSDYSGARRALLR